MNKNIIFLLFFGHTFLAASASAGPIADAINQKRLDDLGPLENCGSPPGTPNSYDNLINGPQKKALHRYNSCMESNEERRRLSAQLGQSAIRDRARESCENAIRRISSNPATLSFDYKSSWNYTDGGYSVEVSGSDIGGNFRVTCYTDKSYRVIAIR